jgi:pimeloyl-ACP methyl ester carboxylesterase
VTSDVGLQPYALVRYDGEVLLGELGTFTVPARRHDPESGSFRLTFLRLPSTAADPGPPIFFLAGGPGSSAIESLRRPDDTGWFDALRATGDLVLLEQRGTGLSRPRPDCPQRLSLPLDVAGSRESFLDHARQTIASAVEYWQRRGPDLDAWTTVESADDVDDLREHLGYESMSLEGGSYGSHLGIAVLRRHGRHVHRAVLSFVEGPDHTVKLPATVDALLDLLATRAREQDVTEDLRDLVGSVLERLERTPVRVPVAAGGPSAGQTDVTLGRFDLEVLAATGLGDLEFIKALPARFHRMWNGDLTWAAQASLRRRSAWLGSAMAWAMDCASGATAERLREIERQRRATLLGDLINFPLLPELIPAWPVADLGDEFRTCPSIDTPVLFLSGSLDGRTPPRNVEELLPSFTSGEHLVVEGLSHGRQSCPAEALVQITRFLRGASPDRTSFEIPVPFERFDAHDVPIMHAAASRTGG